MVQKFCVCVCVCCFFFYMLTDSLYPMAYHQWVGLTHRMKVRYENILVKICAIEISCYAVHVIVCMCTIVS